MPILVPQCTGLSCHDNRSCDYSGCTESADCHLWYVSSYSWWDALDMKGDDSYEKGRSWWLLWGMVVVKGK